MIRMVLAAAVVAAFSGPAAAQGLGRLFLTPEQRATLDARRQARVPDKPAPAAVAEAAPVTRIDGYVQRPGGKSTVWVNGQPITEDTRGPSARIQPDRAGVPSVALQGTENTVDLRARAGQSVETATGVVKDPLGDGEIRVRRATPPAPPAPPAREGRSR